MENNLLDKASILLTPTAYNDGRMLSVKPNENLYGSELVTNGDFATDSDWSLVGSNVSISGGKLNFVNATFNSEFAQQSIVAPIGKTYKITLDVSNLGSGESIKIRYPFQDFTINTNGTHILYGVGDTANVFRVTPNSSTASFSIDNISVKEDLSGDFTFSRGSAATRVNVQGLVENVQILSDELVSNGNFSQEGSELITNGGFDTDSDWTLTQAIISNGSASFATTDGSFAGVRQTVFSVGKTYLISLDVSNLVGTIEVNTNGGASIGLDITTDGTKSFYMKAESVDIEIKRKFGAEQVISATIDNISVKEVGQDWTLGTGWSVDQANSKATFDYDTSIQKIYTSNLVLNSSNNYKLSFEIKDILNGTPSIFISNSGGSVAYNGNYTEYSEGVHTFTFSPSSNQTSLAFFSRFSDFSISNISVKEITDDTDLPRIDYTDGCGSWLLEGQSTNLITYSSDYSQSFYSKDSGVSVGTTNNFSPSGDLNATQINVTDNGRIYANMSSLTYYSTVFIKAGTFSYFKFAGVNVDLVAQTISSGTIKSYGNGWFRIGVAYTGNRPFQVQAYPDATYSSHSTSGSYYIWGSQAEQQSYATSYIPTNGSIATRLADVATNSGNSTLINSTEGVLYVETTVFESDVQNTISISNGTTGKRVFMGFGIVDNEIACSLTGGFPVRKTISNIKEFNKIAFAWGSFGAKLFINGVLEDSNTSVSSFVANDLTQIDFMDADGNPAFYGKTKALAVYKEALTDEQLQSLTTI